MNAAPSRPCFPLLSVSFPPVAAQRSGSEGKGHLASIRHICSSAFNPSTRPIPFCCEPPAARLQFWSSSPPSRYSHDRPAWMVTPTLVTIRAQPVAPTGSPQLPRHPVSFTRTSTTSLPSLTRPCPHDSPSSSPCARGQPALVFLCFNHHHRWVRGKPLMLVHGLFRL